MVGIWAGDDILFARARTCQNGIVGVSRRIDIPRMVFIRVMDYAELCVTMRVRRRIVLSSSPCPLFSFFEARRISIFFLPLSLFCSLFIERRIELQCYKWCPRCVESPFTRVSICVFHVPVSLRNQIFHFRNAEDLGSVASYFLSKNFSSIKSDDIGN